MRKNNFFFLNHQILIENQGGKKIEYGLTASKEANKMLL